MDMLTLFKSWKTTIFGVLVALLLAWPSVQGVFDDDPTTGIEWSTFGAATALLGLGVVSKDGDMSSRKLGI